MSAKRRYHGSHGRGRGGRKKPNHGRMMLQSELEERGWSVEMRKHLLPPAGRVNVPDGRGGAVSERFWWERDVLAKENTQEFRLQKEKEQSKQRRRARQMEEFCRRMAALPGNYYNFHPGSHVGQGRVSVGARYEASFLFAHRTDQQRKDLPGTGALENSCVRHISWPASLACTRNLRPLSC